MESLLDHEISIESFDEKLRMDGKVFVLDVREAWEFLRVRIDHSAVINLPVSQLMGESIDQLETHLPEKHRELLVLCHHGIRSERITRWLREQGWGSALSVAGGIDRYASMIDPSIGYY